MRRRAGPLARGRPASIGRRDGRPTDTAGTANCRHPQLSHLGGEVIKAPSLAPAFLAWVRRLADELGGSRDLATVLAQVADDDDVRAVLACAASSRQALAVTAVPLGMLAGAVPKPRTGRRA